MLVKVAWILVRVVSASILYAAMRRMRVWADEVVAKPPMKAMARKKTSH
jgi:hypothetical protein